MQETGEDWLRFRVSDPRTVNPQLLRQVAGLGIDVVTLAPVSQTLEDIYLEVVTEDEEQEAQAHGKHQ